MDLFPHQHKNETKKDESSSKPPIHFVRVAIERGLDRMDGLTYSVDSLCEVGRRVIVPVGRGNTPTGGIVIQSGGVELLDGFDRLKIKPIIEITHARIPESLVELARWMSTYYMCPLGMVFETLVPAAVKSNTGARKKKLIAKTGNELENSQVADLTPKVLESYRAIEQLNHSDFPIDAKLLASRIDQRSVASINKLVQLGYLSFVEIETIQSPKQFQLLDAGDSGSHELSDTQKSVVEGITESFGDFKPHLLFGVTGSGKTEVYINLIHRVLEQGKQVIVLVPEIALTPQTAGRFVHCFEKHGVAVLHSGLTRAMRNQQWALASSGKARVVVGARSAIFAPLDDVGLIIVDEEHDPSYKQDQLPRYNARDAAVKRGHIEQCPVVLGSATPSLESWANMRAEKYALWSMPERVGLGSIPNVQIVDMSRSDERSVEPNTPSKELSIGRSLTNQLNSCLDTGQQAILLLNRRGFASLVVSSDRNCGWKLECSQCDATMVVHRGSLRTQGGGRFVRCHHCLSEQRIPTQCPITGKPVIELGAGTQRVEEEIVSRFADRHGLVLHDNFVRVDTDTMRNASDYFDVLDRFSKGEIKLLLGTQMIAKGLDFPNVSLVGVINADTSLSIPDFRAEERTYQLVSQVAGRAGRGAVPGNVIVQTMNPSSKAIVLASKHDYVRFADSELKLRTGAKLPPAHRMVRIVVRDESNEKAQGKAELLADMLRRNAHQSVLVVGAMPCSITRVSNQYRWSIEMYAPSPMPMQHAMKALRDEGLLKSDSKTAVDVDPIWLM